MMKINNRSWGNDTRFYRLTPWLSLRKQKIELNPLCELCESVGTVTVGAFVDHILNRIVFGEYELELLNLQTLCGTCHSQKTALERQYKTKEAYLKAFRDGKLKHICTEPVKEALLDFIGEKEKAL